MAAGWLSRVQLVENTNVQVYSSAKFRLPLDVEVSDQVSPQAGDCTSSSSVQDGSCQRNEPLFLGFPSIPKEDARTFTLWQVKKEGTAWLDSAPSELERMGSGMSTVSGCGGSGADSDMGDEGRRLSTLTEPGKLPSSQFKGVVPQPNGRWGAQIYEKHQRLWLGTFNEEGEAAKAYDRAALKFRGRDAMTNFSPVGDGDPEAMFLNMHTKEQIVDMLRRHTYEDELEQSSRPPRGQAPAQEATLLEKRLRDSSKEAGGAVVGGVGGVAGGGSGYSSASSLPREHLFEKALTPSDVGKLNRLVIPKQHAERCFPLDANSNEKGLLLNFEDPSRKVWRFRYCYWNSSQSYVLTKGWSRFVKEKKLSAGDIVSYERAANDHLFISCRRRPASCTSLQRQNHQRFSEQQALVPASIRAQLVSASSLQSRNLHPSNFISPWRQTAEKFNQNGANRLGELEAFVQQCRPHSSTISAGPAVLLPQEVSNIWHSGSIAWTSFGLADRLTSAGGFERGAPGSVYQASINGIRSDSSVGLQGTIGSSHSDARVPTSDRTSTVDFKFFGAHVTNKHSTETNIAGVQDFSESSRSREEMGSLLELNSEQGGHRPSASQRRLVTSNATHEASVRTKQGLRLFGVDLVPSVSSPVSLHMKLESEQAVIGENLTLDLPCNGRWVDQKAKSDACVYTSKMGTAGGKRKFDVLDAESSAESCHRKFKSPSI